jgi:hypothetical protein
MHEQDLLGGYINKGSKAFIPMRGASSIHRRRHDPAVLGPAPTTQRIRFRDVMSPNRKSMEPVLDLSVELHALFTLLPSFKKQLCFYIPSGEPLNPIHKPFLEP